MEFEVIQSQILPIGEIRENRGQVPGLPANPRKISLSKLRKLEQSIRDYPEMLSLREVLVYPYNGKYVVIGGNMRFQAMKRMAIENIPCKVISSTATSDQIRAYMLRDNSHFGEWDFGDAINFDFADLELAQIPVPTINFDAVADEARKRAAWHSGESKKERMKGNNQEEPDCPAVVRESLCDLVARPSVYMRDEMAFASTFKKSVEGVPLSEIKTVHNVDLFARSAEFLIRKILRFRTGRGWALVTTPCRRHKESNFSEMVCCQLADFLRVRFHSKFATAKNRDRIKPVFTPQYEIEENNLILYDDIFTTGVSIRAMLDLLSKKNVVVIVGINNN